MNTRKFESLGVAAAAVLMGAAMAAPMTVHGAQPARRPAAPAAAAPQQPNFDNVQIRIVPVQGRVYLLNGAGGNTTVQIGDDGVLVVASGDVVHNLRLFNWHDPSPLPWALRFRDRVNALVREGDLAALADWPALGEDARLSIPTPEHYLPLLYALALARDGDALRFFNDDVTGSLSMTSLLIGHA